ncbi:MAG: c-type cytochrome [Candidatus Binatia bacterium]
MHLRWPVVLYLVIFLSACSKNSTTQTDKARAPDAARGRRVYLANCTTCHNTNPSRPGVTGPAIKGSSKTLIEARVLRAGYPTGYSPKRKSSLMRAKPYLKSTIPDLAAFLNSSP